jgi:predicted transcriptional regulator
MIYTNDIEAKDAIETLDISFKDLKQIVNSLVERNILKNTGNDEFELTSIGQEYIVEKMKKNLEKE